MTLLGVNIDHVATVRQARREKFPDPLQLAQLAVQGGANSITAHLREDRRHIQDADLFALKGHISVPLNMEMAIAPEIVKVAKQIQPEWTCLVPEKREELTTEGGLDVKANQREIKDVIQQLHESQVRVSLFIDADIETVRLAKECQADAIEIHTGRYAFNWSVKGSSEACCSGTGLALRSGPDHEIKKIKDAVAESRRLGLKTNAGHGLDRKNLPDLLMKVAFDELNIGFAIVAEALEVGMEQSVKNIKDVIEKTVCVES